MSLMEDSDNMSVWKILWKHVEQWFFSLSSCIIHVTITYTRSHTRMHRVTVQIRWSRTFFHCISKFAVNIIHRLDSTEVTGNLEKITAWGNQRKKSQACPASSVNPHFTLALFHKWNMSFPRQAAFREAGATQLLSLQHKCHFLYWNVLCLSHVLLEKQQLSTVFSAHTDVSTFCCIGFIYLWSKAIILEIKTRLVILGGMLMRK